MKSCDIVWFRAKNYYLLKMNKYKSETVSSLIILIIFFLVFVGSYPENYNQFIAHLKFAIVPPQTWKKVLETHNYSNLIKSFVFVHLQSISIWPPTITNMTIVMHDTPFPFIPLIFKISSFSRFFAFDFLVKFPSENTATHGNSICAEMPFIKWQKLFLERKC